MSILRGRLKEVALFTVPSSTVVSCRGSKGFAGGSLEDGGRGMGTNMSRYTKLGVFRSGLGGGRSGSFCLGQA